MSWWDSTDAFASLYGKTQSRNWRHAMPSILFMNWELLSGVLTDNIVKTCQHSSANAKGSRHVSTAAFSRIFFSPPQNWYDEGGWEVNWSRGSNSIVLKHPFFTLFWNNFALQLSHMGTPPYWLQSRWKERVCCCVNCGNDLLTPCVCVHCWLYCPILMFTV